MVVWSGAIFHPWMILLGLIYLLFQAWYLHYKIWSGNSACPRLLAELRYLFGLVSDWTFYRRNTFSYLFLKVRQDLLCGIVSKQTSRTTFLLSNFQLPFFQFRGLLMSNNYHIFEKRTTIAFCITFSQPLIFTISYFVSDYLWVMIFFCDIDFLWWMMSKHSVTSSTPLLCAYS